MMASPLSRRRDYGEPGGKPQDYSDEELAAEAEMDGLAQCLTCVARELLAANPYLNTAPTKLRRDLGNEKDLKKRKQMRDALNAWRTTVPGPFLKK